MAAYTSTTRVGPPPSGHFQAGDTFEDATGTVFTCYDTGFPGGWSTGGGPGGDTLIGNLTTSGIVYNSYEVAIAPTGYTTPFVIGNTINDGVAGTIVDGIDIWTNYLGATDITRLVGIWSETSIDSTGDVAKMYGIDLYVSHYSTGSVTGGSLGIASSYWSFDASTNPSHKSFDAYAVMIGGAAATEYTGYSVSAVDLSGFTAVYTGIATVYGFRVYDIAGDTNTYGVHSALNSGSGKYFLYGAGTAPSYFGGNVGIGTPDVANATLLLAAATTAKSSLRIPSGTAPSSPVEGDMWYDGTNLKFVDAGGTKSVTMA